MAGGVCAEITAGCADEAEASTLVLAAAGFSFGPS